MGCTLSKMKHAISICALWSLGLILPGLLCADTIFTYTSSTVDISFELITNPDSIAAGTNIVGDIVGGSFLMNYPPPSEDEAGFPLGTEAGDQVFTPSLVEIGTNSAGGVTSFDITGTEFASYPAFLGENPTDFFCDYAVTFSNSGGSGPLSLDNDAGFCPGSAPSVAANSVWKTSGTTSPVPEPEDSALLGGGLVGLAVLAARRRRAATNAL